MTERHKLLEQAAETTRERGRDYGPVKENFERIARRWNAHLLNRYGLEVELDPIDVSAMMIDVKLARLAETPHHEDSWLDVIGYGACGGELASTEKERIDKTWADATQGAIDKSPLPYWKNAGVPSDASAGIDLWNDGWTACRIGECPDDLLAGDYIRHKDLTEARLSGSRRSFDQAPLEYSGFVDGVPGRRWFGRNSIIAYKRKRPTA